MNAQAYEHLLAHLHELQGRIVRLEDELDAVKWERDRYRDARDHLQRQAAEAAAAARPRVQPPYVQAEIERDIERRRLVRLSEENNRHRYLW